MGAFVAQVALRWSDMDAFGHVNHAGIVTLLEEGRAALLFDEAVRQGMAGVAEGMVVARLSVNYHAPLTYTAGPIQVTLSVRDLRPASFVVEHALHAGAAGDDRGTALVTAETLIVPYDLAAGRPRRLTTLESEFLTQWRLSAAVVEAGCA